MSREQAALRLRNDFAELEGMARFVAELGARSGFSAKLVHDLQLALEEVVTNVISYAYDDSGEHEIDVRFAWDADEVVVEVDDEGMPFDPLTIPAAILDGPLEDRPIGGLGWHLVRNLMDDVAYRRERGKNVLTLKKRITGSTSSG